ncbi:ArgE/DapE family deacylase [Candidatus Bipolaricaulota bacterium]|nr:ArgE/DapE family deacylase [Candidatus Bipolaricaulota bacterium]
MLPGSKDLRQETIDLLETLIGIRSANPPGDEDRVVDAIEAFLAETGLHQNRVRLDKGRSSLVVRLKGHASGSLVLCGHLDTVNADPDSWVSDPWIARQDGTRLYGLGSADMKSGVAVLVTILRELVRRDIEPQHDIVLVLTADEERGYRGAASVAEKGLIDDALLLLIAEPTGGRAYVGQKGELWVECTFSGQAAHGSIPSSGISALLPAAEFCLDLASQGHSFPEVAGRGQTSLNIGMINAGVQVNIVPDQAKIELDLRVVTESERDRVLELIEEAGRRIAKVHDAKFSYRVFNDRAPITSTPENSQVARFLEVHSRVTGQPTKLEIAPYSTDAVAIVPGRDMPVIIYGPGRIEQAHQPNEYLELNTLAEALEVIGRFVGLT